MAEMIVTDLQTSQIPTASNRYTFGSATRNKAIILEAYHAMNNEEASFVLLKELAEELASGAWMSTQTTAYTLKAIGKTIGSRTGNPGIDAIIKIGTEEQFKVQRPFAYHQIEIPVDALTSFSTKIANQTDQILFARIISSGKPIAGSETADQQGLSCHVQYLDAFGQSLDPASDYSQGTDMKVLTTIANLSGREINEIALTQILPSGWEIRNDRLMDSTSGKEKFDFQDMRDDRLYTYFTLQPGQKTSFLLQVNNTYAGRYYLPGTLVEAMYDRTQYARTAGRWINIVQ
jgi:uncharacterized protein YfaS (alpha-2-macroglobulin family)